MVSNIFSNHSRSGLTVELYSRAKAGKLTCKRVVFIWAIRYRGTIFLLDDATTLRYHQQSTQHGYRMYCSIYSRPSLPLWHSPPELASPGLQMWMQMLE